MKHVIAVIDRSGSMQTIKDDMNGSMKDWLAEMKKTAPKNTIFSAVLFDTEYETPFERVDIQYVDEKPLMIVPRGGTALLDSMMKAMSLVKDGEDALIVVTTDGEENQSKETTLEQLQKRVKELTDSGTEFIYMSSDPNAFDDARKYGSTQTFAYKDAKTMSIYATANRSNSTEAYFNSETTNPNKATSKSQWPQNVDVNIQTPIDGQTYIDTIIDPKTKNIKTLNRKTAGG